MVHKLKLAETPEDSNIALFLSENVEDLNEGASFLDRLDGEQLKTLRRYGREVTVKKGKNVFFQGDPHEGIYLIEGGLVRTYYAAPSGREITLAYWTPGHFVGGPEVFGGGVHVWSGEAMSDSALLFLTGQNVRCLVQEMPTFAICLIDALVAKGKCYSALVQMLGTRSLTARLSQLLLIMAEHQGEIVDNQLRLTQPITQNQLAVIVGSTRQWITMTFDKWVKDGIAEIEDKCIVINRADVLRAMAGG